MAPSKMNQPMITERKARTISIIILLFGLALIGSLGTWWPAIMLVIGFSLAIRQFLQCRYYDMTISLFVFVGVYITLQFSVSWDVLLPVLFTVGGLYLFFREFILPRTQTEVEEEEEINLEISDKKKKP